LPRKRRGLEEGDEIISLGKKNISRENFLVSLSRFKQGDRVPITVKRDRRTIQATLVLGAPERFEYRITERKDATPEQKALSAAWAEGLVSSSRFVAMLRRKPTAQRWPSRQPDNPGCSASDISGAVAAFFAICFGLGYPTLRRYDRARPRA